MGALSLKAFHVLCAVMFLGAGCQSAYMKLRADRSGDPRVIAWYHRELVRSDWIFTLPASLGLLASGLAMAYVHGFPLDTGWIAVGLGAYLVAGLCWIPAVLIQLRLRDLAARALAEDAPLPAEFARLTRIWTLLGIPAFAAAAWAVFAMAAKRAAPW